MSQRGDSICGISGMPALWQPCRDETLVAPMAEPPNAWPSAVTQPYSVGPQVEDVRPTAP